MTIATDTCARCGGNLPAPWGAELDALDEYLVWRDGHCSGRLRTDDTGHVVGCGAWTAEAYEEHGED